MPHAQILRCLRATLSAHSRQKSRAHLFLGLGRFNWLSGSARRRWFSVWNDSTPGGACAIRRSPDGVTRVACSSTSAAVRKPSASDPAAERSCPGDVSAPSVPSPPCSSSPSSSAAPSLGLNSLGGSGARQSAGRSEYGVATSDGAKGWGGGGT